MRKKKIKNVLIFALIAVLAVAAVIRLNIEPADYKEEISKEIVKAQESMDNAVLGNAKEEYSWYTISLLQQSIKEAQAAVDDEMIEYEQLKPLYKTLKEDIKEFKKSANQNCLSKEEIGNLKAENAVYEGSSKLSDGSEMILQLDSQNLNEETAFNYEVTDNSVYETEIAQILEEQYPDTDYTILSFCHNEDFPCSVMAKMDTDSTMKEVQIFRYDIENTKLGTMIRGEVSKGKILFPVTKGGTYVVIYESLEVSSEEASAVKETESKEAESKETQAQSSGSEEESDKTKGSKAESVETSGKSESSAAQEANESTKSGETKASQKANESKASKASHETTAKTTASATKKQTEAETEAKAYATIEIRCDTIVDTSKLTNQAVAPYVPSDGTILKKTKIEITEGESVFEVLKRVTRNKNIQMEFRNDPLYSGAYIEGINYIYEYDGGNGSGWMYKVNGWFPNYGCSQYKVQDGDEIIWCYTCDIGKDVGDQYYENE